MGGGAPSSAPSGQNTQIHSNAEQGPADTTLICENPSTFEEATDTDAIKRSLGEITNDVKKIPESCIKLPGNEATNETGDEVVEHFFEGLDEDAFIANLQVVSSWEGNEPLNNSPKLKKKMDKSSKMSPIQKPRAIPKVHQESALSRFQLFIADDKTFSSRLTNRQNADGFGYKKRVRDNLTQINLIPNKNLVFERSKKKGRNDFTESKVSNKALDEAKPASNKTDDTDISQIASRRDPDKTKRDIEKDKVNKCKDSLIKKMESGLVPPGTEMEITNAADSTTGSSERRSKKHRSKSKSLSYTKRRYSPGYSRQDSRTRSPKRSSQGKYSRFINQRKKMRAENEEREYKRKINRPYTEDVFERYRIRRKSRSKESSPKYKRTEKPENFLSYLSKHNLITPTDRINYSIADTSVTYTMTPEINSQQYMVSPYAQPTNYVNPMMHTMPPGMIPQGVPPPMMLPQTMPDPGIINMHGIPPQGVPPPIMDQYYTNPPSIVYDMMPISEPSLYPNTYVSNESYTNVNLIMQDALPNNTNVQYPSTEITPAAETTPENVKKQEEKDRIIKNCENVLKKLNNVRVPSHIVISSEEDAKQRECAFRNEDKTTNYISPLNRNPCTYTFTSTGDRNRMIFPSITTALNDATLTTPVSKAVGKKDCSTQTVDFHCDRCHLSDRFDQEDKSTSTIGMIATKSEFTQVEDWCLANSRMLFTPNQKNTAPEPQKPVSLTHLTPAQILVNELATKTKFMQRSAVDSFRQAGGSLDDSIKKYGSSEQMHYKIHLKKPSARWDGTNN